MVPSADLVSSSYRNVSPWSEDNGAIGLSEFKRKLRRGRRLRSGVHEGEDGGRGRGEGYQSDVSVEQHVSCGWGDLKRNGERADV